MVAEEMAILPGMEELANLLYIVRYQVVCLIGQLRGWKSLEKQRGEGEAK
ncbi:unnamed protein product [marine sediment metagenome]|uniref:Uncharacterized protein n=1 Tax=marine sediment metagenome TaxID=412755 RepID=X1GZX4_9ZZZZ